ncbi:hypothetical protein N9370_01555 [Paracoccaceae bacterium]|nr:hypothetical protein [Paracoccaceae bacterium]
MMVHLVLPILLALFCFGSEHTSITIVGYLTIANLGLKFLGEWYSDSLDKVAAFSLRWIVPVSVLYSSLWSEELQVETSETAELLVFLAGLHLVLSLLFELKYAFRFYAEEGGWRFFKWLIPTFLATLALLVIFDFLGLLRL